MALRPIKVSEQALSQLSELLNLNSEPECHEKIKTELSLNVSECISKLWLKYCSDNISFILIDDATFEIIPKKEHRQFLHDITGIKGPYTVVQTCRSWVGLSEGVYKLKNCDKFLPVAWFEKTQLAASPNWRTNLLVLLLIFLSILQSLLLLLIF